jgi:hypothetical protein
MSEYRIKRIYLRAVAANLNDILHKTEDVS